VGGVELKDQMLQPYLLEWKKGSKAVVCKITQEAIQCYHSQFNGNKLVSECIWRNWPIHIQTNCSLPKDSKKNTGLQYIILYMGAHLLNYHLKDRLNTIFWRRFPPLEVSLNLRDIVW
jgi:hypothetical protein